MTHHNLVHKFIPMPQAMKIPDAKAAVNKEREKLEKLPALSEKREDHIASKRFTSMKHYNLVHKFVPMPRFSFAREEMFAYWTVITSASQSRKFFARLWQLVALPLKTVIVFMASFCWYFSFPLSGHGEKRRDSASCVSVILLSSICSIHLRKFSLNLLSISPSWV